MQAGLRLCCFHATQSSHGLSITIPGFFLLLAILKMQICLYYFWRVSGGGGGRVVEYFTWDQGVAGLSLTRDTVLCP